MKITRLELHNPGVYLGGSLATIVEGAAAPGVHKGWTMEGDAIGVRLSKSGATELIPWSFIKKATLESEAPAAKKSKDAA
jgi:hypothetical protein